jgi:hypothetical protein
VLALAHNPRTKHTAPAIIRALGVKLILADVDITMAFTCVPHQPRRRIDTRHLLSNLANGPKFLRLFLRYELTGPKAVPVMVLVLVLVVAVAPQSLQHCVLHFAVLTRAI